MVTEVKSSSAIAPEMRLGDEFAINLFKAAARNLQSNMITSPLSVFLILGLLREAASGNSLVELNSTLNLQGMSDDSVSSCMRQIISEFRSRDESILKVVNALWLKTGFHAASDFSQKAVENYKCQMSELEFADVSAVQRINNWVNAATDGNIPAIVGAADLSDTTRMVLTNAVYFAGKWHTASLESRRTIRNRCLSN